MKMSWQFALSLSLTLVWTMLLSSLRRDKTLILSMADLECRTHCTAGGREDYMVQLPGNGLTLSKQLTDPIMKTESLRTSAVVNLKSIKSSLSSGNSVWGEREGGRKWRGGREGGREGEREEERDREKGI